MSITKVALARPRAKAAAIRKVGYSARADGEVDRPKSKRSLPMKPDPNEPANKTGADEKGGSVRRNDSVDEFFDDLNRQERVIPAVVTSSSDGLRNAAYSGVQSPVSSLHDTAESAPERVVINVTPVPPQSQIPTVETDLRREARAVDTRHRARWPIVLAAIGALVLTAAAVSVLVARAEKRPGANQAAPPATSAATSGAWTPPSISASVTAPPPPTGSAVAPSVQSTIAPPKRAKPGHQPGTAPASPSPPSRDSEWLQRNSGLN